MIDKLLESHQEDEHCPNCGYEYATYDSDGWIACSLCGYYEENIPEEDEEEECEKCDGNGEVNGKVCKKCDGHGFIEKESKKKFPKQLATDIAKAIVKILKKTKEEHKSVVHQFIFDEWDNSKSKVKHDLNGFKHGLL
jgi:uncharacterized Zn finger protein (UPF0148 family)